MSGPIKNLMKKTQEKLDGTHMHKLEHKIQSFRLINTARESAQTQTHKQSVVA